MAEVAVVPARRPTVALAVLAAATGPVAEVAVQAIAQQVALVV